MCYLCRKCCETPIIKKLDLKYEYELQIKRTTSKLREESSKNKRSKSPRLGSRGGSGNKSVTKLS